MPLNIKGSDSLYWSTGLDTSGLGVGANKAMGILNSLASNISKADIFAGLGLSAAFVLEKAAEAAFDFSRKFETAMTEVATISNAVRNNYEGMSKQIVDMSKDLPEGPVGLTKALYEVVSAGYDGAEAIEILGVASKAAVGGVTNTKVAVDGLTTVLNAFHLDASKATLIADQMFNTVVRGKVTFEELANNMSTVAPLAASTGVAFEQVMAAVQTLTKQGTPAAEAMTQIRSAILSTNEQLGDGWAKTMSLQEAFLKLQEKADGSQTKLREMMGRVEALNAVLGLTGENAKTAAEDLDAIRQASAEAERAFQQMVETADNQIAILGNNVMAKLKPLGDGIKNSVNGIVGSLNEMFNRTGNNFRDMANTWDGLVTVMQSRKRHIEEIIATIDDLANKTKLTTDETYNLKSAESELAIFMPKVADAMNQGKMATELLTIARNGLLEVDKEILDMQRRIAEMNLQAAKLDKQAYELEKDTTAKIEENARERMNVRRAELRAMLAPLSILRDQPPTLLGSVAFNRWQKAMGMTIEQIREQVKKLREEGLAATEIYDQFLNQAIQRDKEYLKSQTELSIAVGNRELEERRLNIEIEKQQKNLDVLNGILDETKKKTKEDIKPVPPETFDEEKFKELLSRRLEDYELYLELLKTKTREQIEFEAPIFADQAESFVAWLNQMLQKYAGSNETAVKQINETLLKATDALKNKFPEMFEPLRQAQSGIFESWIEENKSAIEKINEITIKYAQLRAEVEAQYTDDQKAQMIDRLSLAEQEELERVKLTEQRVSQQSELEKFRNEEFLKNTAKMSIAELKEYRDNLAKKLDGLKKYSELWKAIYDRLKEVQDEIWDREQKRIHDIGQSIKALGEFIKLFNDDMGESINIIGDMVNDVGNLVANIAQKDVFGSIASGFNVLTDIVGLFRDTEKHIENTVSLLERFNTALEKQQQIVARSIAGQKIKELRNELKLLEDELFRLLVGQFVGFISKEELERIEQLRTEIFNLKNELYSLVTGTSIDAIADAIVEGFRQGLSPLELFADTFENMMTQALINSFKNEIVTKYLQGFYERFALMAEDGLTSAEIDILRTQWAAAVQAAYASWEDFVEFAAAAGIELGEELAGGIEQAVDEISIDESIIDQLQNAIMEGKSFAEIFSQTLEDSIKAALQKAFRDKILLDRLNAWYEMVQQQIGAGELNMFDVSNQLAAIIGQARYEWEKLVEIAKQAGLDIDFGEPPIQEVDKKKGLAGAISGITEETAGLLAGQFNAIRMNTVSLENISKEINYNIMDQAHILTAQLGVLGEIRDNTANNIYMRKLYYAWLSDKLSRSALPTNEDSYLRAVGA